MIINKRKYRNIAKQIVFRILKLDFYFGQRAILDEDLKLVYVPIPKCANSHIKKALLSLRKNVRSKDIHDKRNFRWLHPKDLKNYTGSGEYHVFCVVRDPRDRILSAYKNKVVDMRDTFLPVRDLGLSQGDDFDTFMQRIVRWPKIFLNDHFKPQVNLLHGYKHENITFYRLESKSDMKNLEKALRDHGCEVDLSLRTNASSETDVHFSADTLVLLDRFLKNDDLFYQSVLSNKNA